MELIFLDPHRLEALTARVNADPEFRLAARVMRHHVHLRASEGGATFFIEAGHIIRTRLDPFLEPWDFCIAAGSGAWRKLLAPVPPPFYNHLYAAMFRRTLRIEGDLEAAFSSLASMSRMVDLMRIEQNRAEVPDAGV